MTPDLACITSAGGRAVNQDSCGYAEANGAYCLIVADGVGGYSHGEYASQLAVAGMKEAFLAEPSMDETVLRRHMEAVARKISGVIHGNPELKTMKTTLAVLCMDGKQVTTGHIGDSRVYLFQGKRIISISQDHSLVMRMVLQGELRADEIRGHPKRNVLVSAIGADMPKMLDTVSFDFPLDRDSGVLLCSDGFWELIAEEEMSDALVLSQTASEWLRGMEQLVGNRQSGHSDNYTCLAARLRV